MMDLLKRFKSIQVDLPIVCNDPECIFEDKISLIACADGSDDISSLVPELFDFFPYEEQPDGKLLWDGFHIVKSKYEIYYCKKCKTLMTRENTIYPEEIDFTFDKKCETCGEELVSGDNLLVDKIDNRVSVVIGNDRHEVICPECKQSHVRKYNALKEIFSSSCLSKEKYIKYEELKKRRGEKKKAKIDSWNALPEEEKKRIMHRKGKLTKEESDFYFNQGMEEIRKEHPEIVKEAERESVEASTYRGKRIKPVGYEEMTEKKVDYKVQYLGNSDWDAKKGKIYQCTSEWYDKEGRLDSIAVMNEVGGSYIYSPDCFRTCI